MAKSVAPADAATVPLCLIWGDDDFTVKQRAKKLFHDWCQEAGGMDHEIVDAAASNAGEALQAIAKLRMALDTLPFFGSSKVIWLQNCSFLGEDRTSSSSAVTEATASLAEDLKRFPWNNVRLIISAGKADKRRVFYKTVEKLGLVENYNALSADDRDWAAKAEAEAVRAFRIRGKEVADEALAELVQRVGPNLTLLNSEVEKLSLYAGERAEIGMEDVLAIVSRNKMARAFALAEALGDRDLPKLLKTLDEELWEIRAGVDKSKSEIGLLYGLISKVRTLILLKELKAHGWIKGARDYNSFKAQLETLPAGEFPEDRRYNPLALHPYTLFQASRQIDKYELPELVRAMELLLDANRNLVSSDLDESMVLQRLLLEIVGAPRPKTRN